MRVSIIIPAFNAATTIEGALRSARNQTGVDLEIFVVNDRSTDATEKIVLAAASEDPRVRLIQNLGVQGPSAARNTAIRVSSGDWIVILDADDTMADGRVKNLIDQAEARGLDVITDNIDLVDRETGTSLGVAFPAHVMQRVEPIDLTWLLQHDMPGMNYRTFGCCKPIIRAEALERASLSYDEDIRIGEDFHLYGRMLLAGLKFGVIPDRGYQYFLSSSSLVHATRNSDATINVNSRLKRLWFESSHDCRDPGLLRLFDRREAAFRYVDFIYALKSRQGGLMLEAVGKLKLRFALSKLITAAGRRLGSL